MFASVLDVVSERVDVLPLQGDKSARKFLPLVLERKSLVVVVPEFGPILEPKVGSEVAFLGPVVGLGQSQVVPIQCPNRGHSEAVSEQQQP